MDLTRIVTALLALAAFVAAVILLAANRNGQALVTAVLFVGLVLTLGPVAALRRRV